MSCSTPDHSVPTKGSKKEYSDCLFGITDSPVPSTSCCMNSPYPSDISHPEDKHTLAIVCEEGGIDLCTDYYQYYESFDSLKEQQSLQAGYCVIDSQFTVMYEHMNDEDLFSNMMSKNMVTVNMNQIQPESKPQPDDEKRGEFEDIETDNNISGVVDGICRNLDNEIVIDRYSQVGMNTLIEEIDTEVIENFETTEEIITDSLLVDLPNVIETIQPVYTTGPAKTKTITNENMSPVLTDVPNEMVVVEKLKDDANIPTVIQEHVYNLPCVSEVPVITKIKKKIKEQDNMKKKTDSDFVQIKIPEVLTSKMAPKPSDGELVKLPLCSPKSETRIPPKESKIATKTEMLSPRSKLPQKCTKNLTFEPVLTKIPLKNVPQTKNAPKNLDLEPKIETQNQKPETTAKNLSFDPVLAKVPSKTESQTKKPETAMKNTSFDPVLTKIPPKTESQTKKLETATKNLSFDPVPAKIPSNIEPQTAKQETITKNLALEPVLTKTPTKNDSQSRKVETAIKKSESEVIIDTKPPEGGSHQSKTPSKAEELFDLVKKSSIDNIKEAKPTYTFDKMAYLHRAAFKNASKKIKEEYTTQSRKRKALDEPKKESKTPNGVKKEFKLKTEFVTKEYSRSEWKPFTPDRPRRFPSSRGAPSSSTVPGNRTAPIYQLQKVDSPVTTSDGPPFKKARSDKNSDTWLQNPDLVATLERAKVILNKQWSGVN